MSTLSPETWQKLSRHLDEALEMKEEDRGAWLASLREKDPGLASHLGNLLREHQVLSQEHFLEKGPATPLPAAAAMAGQAIGPYTLVSLIGEGGMGSVWLAERNDGRFERRAAVKLLRAHLLGSAGGERFKREGTILARLAHPNIAQLLDAGISASGQPFLVLEYVEGRDIVAHSDQRRLDVEGRLRLFLDVLRAVAHAHANLIVHRDIKPSNVLVRTDGQVKLLDFGIAKLLEDEGAEGMGTLLTREGGAALTPRFAAPEQVTGGPVTVATDVYASGALLYVLLTGQHPAGPGPHSPADLVKAIVETETLRPSNVLDPQRDSTDGAVEAAANRASTPDKLRRSLRGDLDTIVAKALKKNPQERYVSATAFADDLQRYLRHEPISARPDTLMYRTGKFLRRQRLPVAALLLVIVSLAGGLYEVNRERVLSQRRFSDVRRLANKLFDIDVQVRDLPGSTKTRQLIVDTSLEYLRRLAADVQGDPALALDVGNAYLRVARVQGIPVGPTLGQKDQAEKNLKIADDFIQFVLKKEPANRIAMLRAAQIAHDRMILARFTHRDNEAHVLAGRSAEWLDKFHAGKGDEAEAAGILNTYLNVADQFSSDGDYEKALQLCRRGGDIAGRLNRSASRGNFLWVAASVLQTRGDLDEALTTIQESVRLLDPGPDWTTKIGQTLNFGHALVYEGRILGQNDGISLGRPQDALQPLQRAFDSADAIVHRDPNDHASRGDLAMAAITLGGILRHSDARRAFDVYTHALRHLAEVQGDPHLERYEINLLAGSSYALQKLGRGSEARQKIDTALKQLKDLKFYPADKIDLGSETEETLRALADFEVGNRDLPHAIEIYEELLNKMDPPESDAQFDLEDAVHVSTIFSSSADAYRRARRIERASAMDRRRLELWQRWAHKLPNNAFVRQQLEAASRS